MIKRTPEEFGTIDVLVNNAGIYPASSIEELTDQLWDRFIGTNLTGPFLCSRAAVIRKRAPAISTSYRSCDMKDSTTPIAFTLNE